jgi:NADH dehydrogenase
MLKVAIIGGGFCAIACAKRLLELQSPIQINLYTGTTHFEYHGELYKTLSGASPHLTRIPYKHFLDSDKLNLKHAYVQNLDLSNHLLTYGYHQEDSYDLICLAIGASANFFDIPGIAENAYVCRSTDQAIQIHRKIILALQAHDTFRLVIVGAGPAGIEFAGYLAALCQHTNHRYHIMIIDSSERILPVLNDQELALVKDRLAELSIELITGVQIQKYQQHQLQTSVGTIHTTFLLWAAGQKANHLPITGGQLDLNTQQSYQINSYFQTSIPTIFAGGDCSSAPDAGLAWSAVAHGHAIAENIHKQLLRQDLLSYQPMPHPFALPIGPHWALVKVNGKVTIGYPGNLELQKLKTSLMQQLV